MIGILDFHPANMSELALFSYENYLESGRGCVVIIHNDEAENGFLYEYRSGEEALAIAPDQINHYNPEEEILFIIVQPDASLSYKIQGFMDKSGTPKYEHELAHIEDKFKPTPQD